MKVSHVTNAVVSMRGKASQHKDIDNLPLQGIVPESKEEQDYLVSKIGKDLKTRNNEMGYISKLYAVSYLHNLAKNDNVKAKNLLVELRNNPKYGEDINDLAIDKGAIYREQIARRAQRDAIMEDHIQEMRSGSEKAYSNLNFLA